MVYSEYLPFYGLESRKVQKALKMSQKEETHIFSHMTTDTLYGVVKSQTNPDLIYGCYLRADGTYSCQTQKLNNCGGLRGSLCKHIIFLLRHISVYNDTHTILQGWINRSQTPSKNVRQRKVTKYVFTQYLESTSIIIPELNQNTIEEPFSSIDLVDLNRYVPKTYLSPRVKIIGSHQDVPSSKILITPKSTNTVLIETHKAIKQNRETDLSLNYVMCMGDRTRDELRNVEKTWSFCTICKNWLCPSCFDIFMENNNKCPSVFMGVHSHKFESN